MSRKELRELAADMGFNLSDKMVDDFSIYKNLLVEWNQKMNITTITDDEGIDKKHFVDSLTPAVTGLFEGRKRVIDIGTGGGFPGMPLKILNRDLDMTLMDSLNKRITFLNKVIEDLHMTNVQAIHGRAEELGLKEGYRENFDICVSRAVASLDTLSEFCIPFVKVGGYFISMKGPDVEDEVRRSKNAIATLGGEVTEVRHVRIPDSDIVHSLVIVKKVKSTPKKYPRGGGKPKKTPIK